MTPFTRPSSLGVRVALLGLASVASLADAAAQPAGPGAPPTAGALAGAATSGSAASPASPASVGPPAPDAAPALAERAPSVAPPMLAEYEREALAQNLTLSEKQLQVSRRAAEHQVSRAGYYPTVDLSARYTRFLIGGLDLGTLINPAYAALNQVIGQDRFPTDLELKLPLSLEAKLELRQPVYVPALSVARRLTALGSQASEVELALARREVVFGVRAAYLGHAQAAAVAALLRDTRALLEENLRVSEQLVAADKQTADVVFRARAELAAHDQLLRQVTEQQRAAARALNNLRGRPGDAAVAAPETLPAPAAIPVGLPELLAHARGARAELRLVGVGRRVAETERDLVATGSLPTVALALDYGVQSGDLSPSLDDDFATVSLVASWNVLDGGRDTRRRRGKSLEIAAAEVRRRQVSDQIETEVRDAYGAAEVALAAIAAADERVRSAQAAYDIISKKYAAGALPQIEVIAARTALLQAGTDRIAAGTDIHLRLVELERVTEFPGSLR